MKFRLPAPFSKDVVMASVASGEAGADCIYPEEAALLGPNATDKRQKEFALGRAAARAALEMLGVRNFPVLKGSRKEPLWPPDIVGSITHFKDTALCAVSRREIFRGVGVDLQSIEVFSTEILPRIASKEELNWCVNHENPVLAGALLFSVKESFYKAASPIVERYIGFNEIELRWNDQSSTFDVFIAPTLPELSNLKSEVVLQVKDSYAFSLVIFRNCGTLI